MNFRNYVNVRQGTQSVPELSHGNTLPLTALPHGMNHFATETRGTTHALFYHPTDNFTTGIRLTHAPSPWINDYATFTMMATSGDKHALHLGKHCRSSFTQARTLMTPTEILLPLQLFRTEMHLVPTLRGAIIEMTYHDQARRRFNLAHVTDQASVEIDAETRCITGYTSSHTWPTGAHFAMYYVIEFDADFDLTNTQAEGSNLSLAFATDAGKITARLATSFISLEQAMQNLDSEVRGKCLPCLRAKAEQAWDEKLSLIEISAVESVMRTFYSCLYRMMLFPRVFHEVGKDGVIRHYNPDSDAVHEGVFYTDNGFWDTYKTVYPLYSIILPDLYREMCVGFCNYFDETGWLPRWLSPGAVNCMPGTAIDAVFGDAAAKNVVTDPALLERMLKSTMRHITEKSDKPEVGRDGVEAFRSIGYVSSEYHESVNKTQDYAYGDFCVSRIAEKLGKTDVAAALCASSLNYRNLFDRESGFLRARNAQGEMRDDWTPIQWGGDYTEGSAWQNSLAMFHDYGGMTKLMGGKEAFEQHLDALFATKPDYDVYGYGVEIHEMLEMAAVDFGQCAVSNQPSFHIPYLYSVIGKPEKTQYWIRKIMAELFNDSPCGFPGDEDNGSMAGFYVFSALGFYPVCPGAPEYVLGSPCVSSATIHLKDGGRLQIDAENMSDLHTYVKHTTLNGKTVDATYLTQDQIVSGGYLRYEMSKTAGPASFSDAQLPYSLQR